MLFLKDVIASRQIDGNIPRPNYVIDSGRSTKHSEEEIVTDPNISTNENQVQEKRDIINSMIHSFIHSFSLFSINLIYKIWKTSCS